VTRWGRHSDTLPSELRPDQRAILLSQARFKVVACGRRWGKTTLGLTLAACHAERYGRRVWWVAPTYGLAFHPWLALKAHFAGRWVAKLEAEHYLELPGGGSVTVKTADNPDLLRGVGLDLVIVDEAAFVPRITWEAVLVPALADRRGRALLISTPRGRNWFWEAFQRGETGHRQWRSWRFPTSANPIIAPDEIEAMRVILPERIFRQEYDAEFLPGGGAVFRQVRDAVISGPPPGRVAGHRYYMGVDFGRYEDFTALAVIDADARPVPALVALDRFSGLSWAVQRGRIAALARRWDVQAILAEANAMGDPNIEALRQDGLRVSGFMTTSRTKGPLIEALVKAVEEIDLRLLDDPVLVSELEAYTYDTEPHTGHTRYFAPPGLHDDTVIALALAWRLVSTPRLALGIAEA
jgi:phage terminase large subunit-like protein